MTDTGRHSTNRAARQFKQTGDQAAGRVPLTLTLSPVYRGEGTKPVALRSFVGAIVVAAWLALPAVVDAEDDTPAAWAKSNTAALFDLYKHLHAHPELSHQEKETAARIAQELKSAGLEVTTGVGGHGVVGILENGDGPHVMVRTDLDALPVVEQTNLVYASQVKTRDAEGKDIGVMHACGHDMHMTCLVGTAQYMAAHRDQWRGTIMFIGQPAEETVGGAEKMLEDGLFTRWPKPELALALHCSPRLAAGTVGYRAGYALANVDTVDVTLFGRGGHGAHPDTTIDPVVMAAHLIVDLQSVVAREIAPGEAAVITVGSIHGGTKHNIIGDRCKLQLTVRSYTDEVRKHLIAAIHRKAKAAAVSAGAPEPKVDVIDGTPALYNDDDLVARVLPVFRRTLGEKNVKEVEASRGGEDFSLYGKAGVPIFMFSLGTTDPQRLAGYARLKQEPPSLHSPQFYPDAEPTLATGVTAMASALLHLLPTATTK
jgi:hippurate hydrolase